MSTTQPIRDPDKLKEFEDYYLKKHIQARNYALCLLGLNTALRISDMLNLRWKNLYDFNRGRFLSHVTVTEQKTGKNNTVVLNPAAREALSCYLRSLGQLPSPSAFLFPSRKGKNCPLGRSQAYRIIREAADAVGLDGHISCHSLRKTFGYHAWRQGTPPALLMDIYNHSSYRITKRYLGIQQDDKDNVFLHISL